mmetsp:Transcript_69903/g.198105  ORF Transcript_69903/g.198105 Transcript_69903/m.198105 type:complete len:241 (-) Transcript_69903:37-759(-)
MPASASCAASRPADASPERLALSAPRTTTLPALRAAVPTASSRVAQCAPATAPAMPARAPAEAAAAPPRTRKPPATPPATPAVSVPAPSAAHARSVFQPSAGMPSSRGDVSSGSHPLSGAALSADASSGSWKTCIVRSSTGLMCLSTGTTGPLLPEVFRYLTLAATWFRCWTSLGRSSACPWCAQSMAAVSSCLHVLYLGTASRPFPCRSKRTASASSSTAATTCFKHMSLCWVALALDG